MISVPYFRVHWKIVNILQDRRMPEVSVRVYVWPLVLFLSPQGHEINSNIASWSV
jgi:hypothetical protein